ncbi:indolepyruvate oxidoreductase subunit beta [bacterium]|nr:indolepyruvate oxidoreductase subunit beta [bacterium]
MKKDFNIILAGVGGQGIITLTRILAETALIEKKDVKTSELHGLSQRGGSVETHIRFGREIYSPLIRQGGADLIISLETQEALKALHYSSKKETMFLVNDFIKPIFGTKNTLPSKQIQKELEKFSKEVVFVPASKIVKEKLGKEVLAGVFLLGYAAFKKLIPLKPNSFLKAIEKVVPKRYFQLNKKTFTLANPTNYE